MSTALSTSRRHRLISSRYSASLFKLFCDFCLDTDLQLVSLRHSNVNSFGQDVMSWKHRPTFVISGMPWAYCDSIDLLPKGRRCFPHQLFCRFHKDATVAYTWCHPANTSYYGLFLCLLFAARQRSCCWTEWRRHLLSWKEKLSNQLGIGPKSLKSIPFLIST